jgi:hypothetical protein
MGSGWDRTRWMRGLWARVGVKVLPASPATNRMSLMANRLLSSFLFVAVCVMLGTKAGLDVSVILGAARGTSNELR